MAKRKPVRQKYVVRTNKSTFSAAVTCVLIVVSTLVSSAYFVALRVKLARVEAQTSKTLELLEARTPILVQMDEKIDSIRQTQRSRQPVFESLQHQMDVLALDVQEISEQVREAYPATRPATRPSASNSIATLRRSTTMPSQAIADR